MDGPQAHWHSTTERSTQQQQLAHHGWDQLTWIKEHQPFPVGDKLWAAITMEPVHHDMRSKHLKQVDSIVEG